MKVELRKIAGLFADRFSGSPTCEACGNEFSCGVSLRGCWCSEIKLNDQALAEMKERYRGCLCKPCLEKMSEPPAIAGG
ncbi:MAG: cysteine-rich CWC family protein [Acidobacteriota bacterium]